MVAASNYHLSSLYKSNLLGVSQAGHASNTRLKEGAAVEPVQIITIFHVIHYKISIVNGHPSSSITSVGSSVVLLFTHIGLQYARVSNNVPSSISRVWLGDGLLTNLIDGPK